MDNYKQKKIINHVGVKWTWHWSIRNYIDEGVTHFIQLKLNFRITSPSFGFFFFPKTPIFSWQRWQRLNSMVQWWLLNAAQVFGWASSLCIANRPCMMFKKKKKKLLGSLLSSILPQSNGTTDMNVERSNNSQLWNLNTSIQNMYYINWYTFLLTPKN